MDAVLDFLRSLYNAERLLAMVHSLLSNPLGMVALAAIVFSETGLLVGFFLPGDSLLFSIGVASSAAKINVYLLAAILMAAAIIGDNVGYFLGRSTGPRIFSRPKSKLFHPMYLQQTRDFYQKYGPLAIVYARFVPIVRTFTPFVAGVAEMPYKRFLAYSLAGGAFWIAFIITLGYRLGEVAFVQKNFEKVVLGIVLLSVVPVALLILKHRRAA